MQFIRSHFHRSPIANGQNNQNWQSVADRINELERQNQKQNQNQNQNNNINNKSIANNQKYTYLDPSKTTRVPNMTLKAFQKNAVQSYFERQQQQQQQISPIKETILSSNLAKLRSNQTVNGSNGNMNYDNNVKNVKNATVINGINGNGLNANVIRPQSLPVNKISTSMESIPQTRLSLPNKLSQIINLTTQLAAQKQVNGNTMTDRHIDRIKTPVLSSPVKSPASKQMRATVIAADKNNLQSINESGVPPPPPRRSNGCNRGVTPVRRYILFKQLRIRMENINESKLKIVSFNCRTSSAAEYSAYRDQSILKQRFSNDLLGPVVMGPIISLDEWIPERPPKNPMLRVPSPDLPPPPSPLSTNPVEIQEIQDDPLPPPPLELLRHMRQTSETENKLNTASRRNSFAGSSSTRKPFLKANNFENLSPPLLPRKPNSMELFNPRPFSSMRQPHGFQLKQAISQAQHAIKANKVIVNGRLDRTMTNGTSGTVPLQSSVNRSPSNESRVSMRKRTHNAPLSVASPDENRMR